MHIWHALLLLSLTSSSSNSLLSVAAASEEAGPPSAAETQPTAAAAAAHPTAAAAAEAPATAAALPSKAAGSGGCCKKKAAAAAATTPAERAATETAGGGGTGGCCGKGKAAAAAAAAAGSKHVPAAGSRSSCCGVMPMTFQASTHTVILFSSWETTNEVFFWLSCFFWFLLGCFSVVLKLLRQHVDRSCAAAAGGAAAARSKSRRMGFLLRTVLRSGFSTLVYAHDYLLMLVVMTFNVFLFFAVCLGLGFGVFMLGHFLVPKPSQTRDEDVQLQALKADPACCGV